MKPLKKRLFFLTSIFIFYSFGCLYASEFLPFQGKLNTIDINIRADSTITSQIISKLNKDDTVEVIGEAYDWYKVRLPKSVPLFVKKNLVTSSDGITGVIARSNVNIRLGPTESSIIVGRLNLNEPITILGETGEWLKIEAPDNTFGWINKRFVDRYAPKIKEITATQTKKVEAALTLEGTIKPYRWIFKPEEVTHRLITDDDKTYLLMEDSTENLRAFENKKARIKGILRTDLGEKKPVVQVIEVEGI